jgi:acetoacetate decarboxylase
MNRDDILKLPSKPAASPSIPHDPFRFVDRQYFIIIYESDPQAIRNAPPEPLVRTRRTSSTTNSSACRTPPDSGMTRRRASSSMIIPTPATKCRREDPRRSGVPAECTALKQIDRRAASA